MQFGVFLFSWNKIDIRLICFDKMDKNRYLAKKTKAIVFVFTIIIQL